MVAAVFLEGYRSAWLPYSGGADNAASNTTSVPNDVVFQLVRRLQKVCAVYLSGLLSRGKLSKVSVVRCRVNDHGGHIEHPHVWDSMVALDFSLPGSGSQAVVSVPAAAVILGSCLGHTPH